MAPAMKMPANVPLRYEKMYCEWLLAVMSAMFSPAVRDGVVKTSL